MNENTKEAAKKGITWNLPCNGHLLYDMAQRWLGDCTRPFELAVCDLFCDQVLIIPSQSTKRSVSA